MKGLKTFIAEQFIKTEIFEMAKSLNDYKDLVENMINPILEHILLILKANDEKNNEYIDHWKKEIRTFLMNFYNVRLKVKNTFETRKKYISDKLINELELDTFDDYFVKFESKLEQEGYDLNNKDTYNKFKELWEYLQDNILDKLIDTIAIGTRESFNNFINLL